MGDGGVRGRQEEIIEGKKRKERRNGGGGGGGGGRARYLRAILHEGSQHVAHSRKKMKKKVETIIK